MFINDCIGQCKSAQRTIHHKQEAKMKTGSMTTQQWKEVFGAVGMSTADMNRWHEEFERRYPEQHREFLEWLNCSPEQIENIRSGRE
jgi:hypothetical protein